MAAEPGSPRPHLVPLVAGAATALFVALTAGGVLPLHVGLQHGFRRVAFPLTARLVPPLAGMLALLLWAVAERPEPAEPRPGRRSRWALDVGLAVLLGTAGITAWTFAVPGGPMYLSAVVLCDGSNSYLTTARTIDDPAAFVRDYPQHMPGLGLHASTQAPGPTLVHWALYRLWRDSPAAQALAEGLMQGYLGRTVADARDGIEVCLHVELAPSDVGVALLIALCLIAAGSAGAWPLYALARRFVSERGARMVVALFLLAPAMWCYAPSIDQLYVPLALSFVLLVLRVAGQVEEDSRLLGFGGLGLLSGLLLVLNLGFVVLPLWAWLLAAAMGWHRGRPGRLVLAAACLLGGWISGVLILRLLLGYNAIATGLTAHELRAGWWGRTYWAWCLANFPEFFIGLGWPVALVAVASLADRSDRPGRALLVATAQLLAIVTLLGVVRGETGRLWLYTAPLWMLGAVGWLEATWPERPLWHWVLLLLAQAVGCAGFWLSFTAWGRWPAPFYSLSWLVR